MHLKLLYSNPSLFNVFLKIKTQTRLLECLIVMNKNYLFMYPKAARLTGLTKTLCYCTYSSKPGVLVSWVDKNQPARMLIFCEICPSFGCFFVKIAFFCTFWVCRVCSKKNLAGLTYHSTDLVKFTNDWLRCQ